MPAVRSGNLLFVSGHGPVKDGKVQFIGKVGREWTEQQGYEAARLTMINLLATVKAALGDLGKVRRVVKLLGMVNCTEEFTRTPQVINGASELLGELYGEAGRHADPEWLVTAPLAVEGVEVAVNKYFLNHPEMVLGEWTSQGTLYGEGYSVASNGDLERQLEAAIGREDPVMRKIREVNERAARRRGNAVLEPGAYEFTREELHERNDVL